MISSPDASSFSCAKIWEIFEKSHCDVIDDVIITEILICGIICYVDQEYAAKTELESVRKISSQPQIITIFIFPLKLIEFGQFQNFNYYLTWWRHRWRHECVTHSLHNIIANVYLVGNKMTELNYSTRDGSNEPGYRAVQRSMPSVGETTVK